MVGTFITFYKPDSAWVKDKPDWEQRLIEHDEPYNHISSAMAKEGK